MKNSHIEWTDHTFNPWEGCTKVSPGCAHCYAEARNQRFSAGANWGPGAPRHRTTPANWKQPIAWNRAAAATLDQWVNASAVGETRPRRPRVFSASLADWLDPEVPIEWLADFLYLVWRCQNLDWLLLTKRPEFCLLRLRAVIFYVSLLIGDELKAFPKASEFLLWLEEWIGEAIGITARPPQNIWVGTTVEDKTRSDSRLPHLLAIPARVRFLSCEPLLGPLEFSNVTNRSDCVAVLGKPALAGIHWVICGGESGPGARPMHPAWARSIREQCEPAGVAFFFKQWGNWLPEHQDLARDRDAPATEIHTFADGQRTFRMGKLTTGRLLDGQEHNAFPSSPIP